MRRKDGPSSRAGRLSGFAPGHERGAAFATAPCAFYGPHLHPPLEGGSKFAQRISGRGTAHASNTCAIPSNTICGVFKNSSFGYRSTHDSHSPPAIAFATHRNGRVGPHHAGHRQVRLSASPLSNRNRRHTAQSAAGAGTATLQSACSEEAPRACVRHLLRNREGVPRVFALSLVVFQDVGCSSGARPQQPPTLPLREGRNLRAQRSKFRGGVQRRIAPTPPRKILRFAWIFRPSLKGRVEYTPYCPVHSLQGEQRWHTRPQKISLPRSSISL